MNPRYCRQYNGFRIRPVRPLRHLSNGAHHNSLLKKREPFSQNFRVFSVACGVSALERDAEAVGDFFVGFDDVTEALAEAVLVHFLLGVFVP